MVIFNLHESNQNAEGACVERLSEQAALKAARRQAEPIPKAFSPKQSTHFRDDLSLLYLNVSTHLSDKPKN